MLIPLLLLIVGLVILLVGGESFVRGAASLAKKLNVSTLVIGLTVVAFGTSMPELVVNLFAATEGSADIAVGNIVGSNIANILLILGIAAIIYPLKVKEGTTWKEIPFSLLVGVVLFLLINDVRFGNNGQNVLTMADGLILLCFFVLFLYYTYGLTKVKGEKEHVETYSWAKSILYIAVGLVGLVLGGKLMVDNGIILARLAGLSELLIGLTVTAVGTSLPELATSAIAAYRKHVDIAVGNVVGSNIFNVLWILGVTPIVTPLHVPEIVNADLVISIVAALLLFAFMFLGERHRLSRVQGAMFVVLYFAYTGFVLMRG